MSAPVWDRANPAASDRAWLTMPHWPVKVCVGYFLDYADSPTASQDGKHVLAVGVSPVWGSNRCTWHTDRAGAIAALEAHFDTWRADLVRSLRNHGGIAGDAHRMRRILAKEIAA